MPTGYTSNLHDGKPTTFPEFAMACARAFGALITLRDDPADAPIPDEFTPSAYHADALLKAQARLQDAVRWSHAESEDQAEASYREALARHEKREADMAAMRARYDAMLREVTAWQPPTPDHDGLKKFMAEQITSSIKFDCYPSSPPARMTGAAYRDEVLVRVRRDIEYHAAEHAKEVARAVERTAWVRVLRDNLREWDGVSLTSASEEATP